jgi:cysteine synthase
MNAAGTLRRLGIGDTPLIPLPGLVASGKVWLKAEYANPVGSVKDRTAVYLMSWARHVVGPGVRVIESTSGNLGRALIHLGRGLDIACTLVMDASAPSRIVSEFRETGADVELVGRPGPGMTLRETRIALADELGRRPGSIWLNQYDNDVGMMAHQESTGREILRDCAEPVDAVVGSVGTGGTICGIAAALRDWSTPPLVVGAEPAGSTISGGPEGDYLSAGSGMRGMPGIVRKFGWMIDRFAHVPDCVAARWALILRMRYGLRVGQTTGAAVAVAALLADQESMRVIAIAPDHGEAFLPAMRRLAVTSPVSADARRIELHDFGPGSRDRATVGGITS